MNFSQSHWENYRCVKDILEVEHLELLLSILLYNKRLSWVSEQWLCGDW